jgi:hypothetical protein
VLIHEILHAELELFVVFFLSAGIFSCPPPDEIPCWFGLANVGVYEGDTTLMYLQRLTLYWYMLVTSLVTPFLSIANLGVPLWLEDMDYIVFVDNSDNFVKMLRVLAVPVTGVEVLGNSR